MTGRTPDALRAYIEVRILPRYDSFDAAHRRDHAETVIRQSPETAVTRVSRSLAIPVAHVRRSLAIAAGRVRHMTLQHTPRPSLRKSLLPLNSRFSND